MNPAPPRWVLGDLEAGHVTDLFQRVFQQAMPEALWHWKYAQGRGVAVGVFRTEDQALVGHYGGTARVLWLGDQRVEAVQCGDVMVASSERGILTRQGPFVIATQAFIDRYIGPDRPHGLGFGFPSKRHLRLGALLGQYRGGDAVYALRWACRAPSGADTLVPVDPGRPGLDRRIDALWRRMAAGLPHPVALGERNADWWRHRYLNHPTHRHLLLLHRSRWLQRDLGLAVVREVAPGDWELLDWLAPPAQSATLLQSLCVWVARRGGQWVSGWFSELVAQHLPAPSQQEPVCLASITVRSTVPAAELDALAGRWWLTGGDTDFR